MINKYNSKIRSEAIKKSYINNPDLRIIRSRQFKNNWEKAKGTEKGVKWRRKHSESLRDGYSKGKIKLWNKDLKGKEYISHYPNGFAPSRRKGKTLKELYGEDKAKEWGNNLSIASQLIAPLKSKLQKEKYKEGKLPKNIGAKGKNNPAWAGGISFEPYSPEFNKNIKREIRERDKMCMICNRTFDKLTSKQIQTHHIDYNKKNSVKLNLIILCAYCHIKTNTNREYWTQFFQKLLSEKYGYVYKNPEIIQISPSKSKL